jgi:3-methyladenine DNA glycosylase Tag
MGFTFGSFNCPHCQNSFSTQNGISTFCPYCGNQVTQKTEPLECSEIADAIKDAPFGGVALSCPHCGSASVTDSANEEIAQLSQVFCTQCGGDMSTELGKLGTSQNQQSVTPREGEMLLSRKATVAVAKLLASHGIEAAIEKVEKDRFRLEAQEELPESLSQEIKDTINDIDSLDRALDEEKSQDETTEESPVMANKSNKKNVKAQETPVESPVETPTEESQDEETPTDEESQDEEIVDEASAMKISSALNKAGVAHTITKVSKNGFVVKAQETEEPTEEAQDGVPPAAVPEGDTPTPEYSDDEEVPMTEQEAEATSAQLKKAGVSHTITRVKKGFVVRAQEVEPTDLEPVTESEPEKETEEDGQYGFPPYTEKGQGEDIVDEQTANIVSAQLKKAGVSHTIKRVSKNGYVVKAQETEEPEEVATDDQDEDDAQSEEEIYTEDQAAAVSAQLKKAGVQHTITRVSKKGFVIAQEIPVEPEPEMVSQDEETEPTEEEGQDEAPIEEVTEGKVLNAKQADKLSASLKKKGVKHSITRVSKNGFVIAQLDDTEEGQYGFPPYDEKAQDEESPAADPVPAPETSQEEKPADEPAEEAVLHEALSNLDELDGVSVADLGMTLYDEETENPHYNLDVKGKPVAAIFLDDQPKPEELRASFVKPDVYGKNFCAAVEKLGLKEVLAQTHARLWTVIVEKNKYAQNVQAKVEANLSGQHAERIATHTANFAHAFNIVLAGLNKNFFSDVDNPLKMALYAALKDRGVDDAIEVIESSFASASDPFFKTVVAKVEEIMAKPREVVDELARTIASVNPVRPEDSAQSYQTLGHRLSSGSVPVVAQASETRRSLSRTEYKEDIKRKIRLGGTRG